MPPAPSSPDPWSTGVYEQGQRGLLECFDAEHILTPSLCTEYVIPSEYGLAITKWTSILGETSPPPINFATPLRPDIRIWPWVHSWYRPREQPLIAALPRPSPVAVDYVAVDQ